MDPVPLGLHDVEFDRGGHVFRKRGSDDFSAEGHEMVGSNPLIMVSDAHPERTSGQFVRHGVERN